jgi:hypothetical protein
MKESRFSGARRHDAKKRVFLPVVLALPLLLASLAGCTALLGTAEKADTTPPGNVTGLVATAADGQVRLVWADPTDLDVRHFELTYTPGGAIPSLSRGSFKTYQLIVFLLKAGV